MFCSVLCTPVGFFFHLYVCLLILKQLELSFPFSSSISVLSLTNVFLSNITLCCSGSRNGFNASSVSIFGIWPMGKFIGFLQRRNVALLLPLPPGQILICGYSILVVWPMHSSPLFSPQSRPQPGTIRYKCSSGANLFSFSTLQMSSWLQQCYGRLPYIWSYKQHIVKKAASFVECTQEFFLPQVGYTYISEDSAWPFMQCLEKDSTRLKSLFLWKAFSPCSCRPQAWIDIRAVYLSQGWQSTEIKMPVLPQPLQAQSWGGVMPVPAFTARRRWKEVRTIPGSWDWTLSSWSDVCVSFFHFPALSLR